MIWVKKRKLLDIKAIKHNGYLYLKIEDLWQALYKSFNLAQHWQVDILLLDEIPDNTLTEWPPFLNKKFFSAIYKCSNNSTPRPDKLSWRHLKELIKDLECLNKFINIANICIKLEYWLLHFKIFISIIILKPNKASYDTSKIFRPIILLNTLGKLIKKVISKRLQFQVLSKNFIYPCQLSRLKQ